MSEDADFADEDFSRIINLIFLFYHILILTRQIYYVIIINYKTYLKSTIGMNRQVYKYNYSEDTKIISFPRQDQYYYYSMHSKTKPAGIHLFFRQTIVLKDIYLVIVLFFEYYVSIESTFHTVMLILPSLLFQTSPIV